MELNYSFIIPHYNTSDLLQRLIDSIPQREDVEIIVVDDNSDDGKKANITRSDGRTRPYSSVIERSISKEREATMMEKNRPVANRN